MLPAFLPPSDWRIPLPRWCRVGMGIIVPGGGDKEEDLEYEFPPYPLIVGGGGRLLEGIGLL